MILENAALMGPRKEAKDLQKGVPGNFYLAQPAFIYIYIYTYINICTMYTVHTHTDFIRGIKKVEKIFECTHII